ncbi:MULTISPECIES: hypothetical protein [Thermus]|uniref:hypothetical protein n=1 Tax=Thermus brockianus TaxID=56956 RepID=UPI001F34EC1A|nr:hypothetical protein [Thermus brockianus]
MTKLENEVRQAFERYRKALEEALEATLERARAKEALEARIAQGLLSGEIQGKNAEEREAKARALYADLYQALAEAEERYQRAKTALEMARSYTEEMSLLARLIAEVDRVA